MAAADYRNTGRGALICYDRAGRETYIGAGATITADIDTGHPPIKAWFDEGRLVMAGEASLVAQREAAEALAAKLEAEAQPASVQIIAGEPRPIS